MIDAKVPTTKSNRINPTLSIDLDHNSATLKLISSNTFALFKVHMRRSVKLYEVATLIRPDLTKFHTVQLSDSIAD